MNFDFLIDNENLQDKPGRHVGSDQLHYKEIEVFPSGMVIEIPEADSQAMKDNRNLPPWKRNKG